MSRMIGNKKPYSQYDRNISFRIEGSGPVEMMTLPIKPQELQAPHPARVTTTQTLQGVYQDYGGLGVQTLTLQGHTGWRARLNNPNMNGFDVFQSLYKNIYVEYHKRVSAVEDPTKVICYLIDDLFDTTYRVSLDDFQPSKSKSNPLLFYYTMHMTVIYKFPDNRMPLDLLGLPKIPSVQLDSNQILNRAAEVLDSLGGYNVQLGPRYYTVQNGDNIFSIALLFYNSRFKWRPIADANHLKPPFDVTPGMQLIVPNQ